MKNSIKKLGISTLLFAMIFGLVSTVHAMTVSELRKEVRERQESILKRVEDVGGLGGLVVNGKSYREVIEKWTKEFKLYEENNAASLRYTPESRADVLKRELKQAEANERSCRNIVSEMSGQSAINYCNAFGYPYCADYTMVLGRYVHSFYRLETNNVDKIYECSHSSKEGFDNHVYWLHRCQDLWKEIQNASNSATEAEEMATEQYVNYAHNKLNEIEQLLEPYFVLAKERLQKYTTTKTEEDNKLLNEFKSQITSMSCGFVLGNKDVGVGNVKLFSKKVKCKSLKNCELRVGENDSHDVGIYCRCKHPLSNHAFKFKKGVNGDELLKKIYEHEVKM